LIYCSPAGLNNDVNQIAQVTHSSQVIFEIVEITSGVPV